MDKIKLYNLFLIVFITYYSLKIILEKKIIEGVDSTTRQSDGTSTTDFKCLGNQDPEKDVNCTNHPFSYKTNSLTIKQCSDGTTSCVDSIKSRRCCDRVTDTCQGNIDQTKDVVCEDNSWPKVNAAEIPLACQGTNDDDPYCWETGKTPLSQLTTTEKQSICCTSRNDFVVAEQFWGIPYLINKASKKYDDSKIIRPTNDERGDVLLNEALELLHEAKSLDDTTNPRYNTTITELILDWATETNKSLGNGMCRGNIDSTKDISCIAINKSPISKAFITTGDSHQVCCDASGLCSGNTNSAEDVTCPDSMTVKGGLGNTVEDCCEDKVTCSGNANVDLNFRCPPPLIPVINSETIYENTQEKCCRHPEDKDITEMTIVSEGETIYGTLIINADFFDNAGRKDTAKRVLFENNFKKDIVKVLNVEEKVNILPEQIVIEKIYDGSIVIDFKVIPHATGISITKEYFSYLLSNKVFLETIGKYTAGGVTNVSIMSWNNIDNWPPWIWNVIIGVVTFLISLAILI